MKLDAMLPADAQTLKAQSVAAAPAECKKKYVSPWMQVIPLGPQRMLATSGASGEPVYVNIVAGVDMYSWSYPPCGELLPEGITCADIRSTSFLAELPNGSAPYSRGCFGYSGWGEDGPWGPQVSGLPADWDEADFLANVEFVDFDCAYPLIHINRVGGAADGPVHVTGLYRDTRVIIGINVILTSFH